MCRRNGRETVGRPGLYATTRHFLDDLGLESLEQLPMLESAAEQAASMFDVLGAPADEAPAAAAADGAVDDLSLIHIPEPTRPYKISYAVFCLKK